MIGKFESNKDLIQELTSSGARHVGNIANIIAGTVAEVTREIGEWITDAIEMNEAAAAARQDAQADRAPDPDHVAAPEDAPATPGATPTAPPYVDAEVVDTETNERP
ncbi:hypothetical protein [Nocardia bovistercoris]|uniref:Uncharacterized protein n=1 Tax=Nocardia bovistercoris TaxID=2785916 RepID=A0A931N0A7_9NOCA|nr:hypothetical protein [Nocardia bovistercoris]MBH0777050.1 hypothetical protein [Nocardia bovistercoris]